MLKNTRDEKAKCTRFGSKTREKAPLSKNSTKVQAFKSQKSPKIA
jgi:hypothetical protein